MKIRILFLKTISVFFFCLFFPFFAWAASNPQYIITGSVDEDSAILFVHQEISNISLPDNSDTLFLILPSNKFKNAGVQHMLTEELGYVEQDFSNISLNISSLKIDGQIVSPSVVMGEYALGISAQNIPVHSKITIDYTLQLPKKIIRDLGIEPERIFLGQFYPYLAPIHNNQQFINPPHAFVEEQLSFADFFVSITLPIKFNNIALTGTTDIITNTDETITVTGTIENAVEFALYGAVDKNIFQKNIQGVEVSLLCDFLCDSEKMFSDTAFILEYYKNLLGDFPFSTLSIVVGKHGDLTGKEYPGMVVLNIDEGSFTDWIPRMEMLLFHEIGHQYFYASVVSDQFNNAWIDEGIVSYLHRRALQEYVQKENWIVRWFYAVFIFFETWIVGHTDILHTYIPGEQFFEKNEYKSMTYGDGFIFFKNLEKCLGKEKMNQFLQVFYQQFSFKNIIEKDLLLFISTTYEYCNVKNL